MINSHFIICHEKGKQKLLFPFLRTCAWGQYNPENEEEETEKQDEPEKPEGEEMETEDQPAKEEKQKKPLKDPYEFIVSGALGNPENPQVKVWKVEGEKFTPMHTLSEHSLGIVSVDVSKNGKCK